MHSLTSFARRWGLILVGIILAIGGLTYGVIPQKTSYQSITKAFIAHYLSGRGTGYMQLEKSSTLYIVNEGEFLPDFSADYLNHGQVLISFLYRTDETTDIDASSDTHVHLKGTAYQVERIILYHQFGQPPEVFSTHQYFQNPDGYYQHHWMAGILLSLLGLIFTGLGLFMTVRRGKKKKQLDFAITTAATEEAVEKQAEQTDQYQEPESVPGNVEYKEFSAHTAQPSKIFRSNE
ncbi:MAG TPA: hypothetical protein VF844_08740 [Ktedonobacteraceae bacterium]